MKEGAGRGSAWTEGGSEGGSEGREGGREEHGVMDGRKERRRGR